MFVDRTISYNIITIKHILLYRKKQRIGGNKYEKENVKYGDVSAASRRSHVRLFF